MLKKLSLFNFKSFKNMNDLEIKDLTIVLGKNSCGKSSIIQSLLLLKQTIESQSKFDLCLDGRYLKASDLGELAFGRPDVESAKIGYGMEINELKIFFDFASEKDENDNLVPVLNNFNLFIDDAIFDLKSKNLSGFIEFLTERGFKSAILRLFHKRIGSVSFNKFLPDGLLVDDLGRVPFDFSEITNVSSQNMIVNSLKNIKYLSPLRAFPQRVYLNYSQDAETVFMDGSNIAHVISLNRNKKVIWHGKKYNLIDALNLCLECVGLSQKVTALKKSSAVYSINASVKCSKKEVSIVDVGFGYSQILPVILMGLLSEKDSLILIEQPEIHLHPASAANLADLFLHFIEDGKRFIIETHSQDFINKLRLRVIQNPKIAKKINIVFVEECGDMNSGSYIRQLELDKEGDFSDWPSGFLDDSENLAMEILKAKIKAMGVV